MVRELHCNPESEDSRWDVRKDQLKIIGKIMGIKIQGGLQEEL